MYPLLHKQLASVLEGEKHIITNASNFSAFIFNNIPDLNWAGFYFYDGKELVLGPFQGKNACVRIAMNKGVCGTSAHSKSTIVVDDVNNFSGHIACDSQSHSEIVIPLIVNNELLGVFDIDSPLINRFDDNDKINLENLVDSFLELSDTQLLSKIYI